VLGDGVFDPDPLGGLGFPLGFPCDLTFRQGAGA
jgi:hypothetical protein